MKNIEKDLINWAINKIENEYKNDISLLLGRRGACKVLSDGNEMSFDFFIPASDRGYSYAKTFIIGDVGYDLFPISWERLENIAALNESIVFCLADSQILYARSEEDVKKFEDLRKTLFNNLGNKEYCYNKALEKINFAMDIYKNMMFENSICSVRKAAGGIIEFLCQAIAIVNGHYIKGDYSYAEEIEQINTEQKKPNNFYDTSINILKAKNIKDICLNTHKLISDTRSFFEGIKQFKDKKDFDFNELAGWYEESRYTFRRLEYAVDNNQKKQSYSFACYLQIELDILSEDAGLKKMDLLSYYDYDKLEKLKEASQMVEKYLLDVMKANNVKLRKYNTLQEFLEEQ